MLRNFVEKFLNDPKRCTPEALQSLFVAVKRQTMYVNNLGSIYSDKMRDAFEHCKTLDFVIEESEKIGLLNSLLECPSAILFSGFVDSAFESVEDGQLKLSVRLDAPCNYIDVHIKIV